MSTAVTHSQPGSPLFKLPGELRNRIYEYALVPEPKVAHYHECDKQLWDTADADLHSELSYLNAMKFTAEYGMSEPGLLATCQDVRREAKGEFLAYSPCKIVLYVGNLTDAELPEWENDFSSLFSRSHSQGNELSTTLGHPNSQMWKYMSTWVQKAQAELFNERFVHNTHKTFVHGRILGFCVISMADGDSRRQPWDPVKGGSEMINDIIEHHSTERLIRE